MAQVVKENNGQPHHIALQGTGMISETSRHRRTVHFSIWLLVGGFAVLILIGASLLVLPVSSQTEQFTSPVTALFTSTSAVCVTGLVVVDTATYWSGFGQAVILALIQLGGVGWMIGVTLLILVLGGKIGLSTKQLVRDSIGASHLEDIIITVKRVAVFSVIVEGTGSLILFVRFHTYFPVGKALWQAVFHSISAFCNAGFDITGGFKSLLDYQRDATIVLTIAFLFILGGIGYIVIADVITKRRFSRLSLDSKIALSVTAILLVFGTLVILASEHANVNTVGGLPFRDKLLDCFFQSATPRTAGFNVIDIGKLAGPAFLFTLLLMIIGGCSGSTAGGVACFANSLASLE